MVILAVVFSGVLNAKQALDGMQKEKTEKHAAALNRLRNQVQPLIEQASRKGSKNQKLAYDQETSPIQKSITIDDSCAHCQKLFSNPETAAL